MFFGLLQKGRFKGKWVLRQVFSNKIITTSFAVFFPLPSCCVSSLLPHRQGRFQGSREICSLFKIRGVSPSFPPRLPSVRFNSLPTIWGGGRGGGVGGGEFELGKTLASIVPAQILFSTTPLHLLASFYKFHNYVGIAIGLNWIKLKYPYTYQQVTNIQTAKSSNAPPNAAKK